MLTTVIFCFVGFLACQVGLVGSFSCTSFLSPKFKVSDGYRKLHPLNSNPRKIDVGEEGGAKGSVGASFQKHLLTHSLLKANEEMELSRQFKLGANILAQKETMTKELARPASDDEVAEVLGLNVEHMKQLVEKGEAAKRILVRQNMRLVFHIAKFYRNRGVAYPDLIQEGTFGLMKAVDKFDPERGFRFSTYASWWIKQAVSRAIAEKSRIVRLPVHIHDMMVSVSKVEKQFAADHSRKPTSVELAEKLCLPVQKVELLVKCAMEVNSIDESQYQNRGKLTSNDVLVKDRLVSETVEPFSMNEDISVRSELRRIMGSLSEREADIVELRFGLSTGQPMTLEEIGKKFNVTRERIRQIEARALSKMRQPVRDREIKQVFRKHIMVAQHGSIHPERDLYASINSVRPSKTLVDM